VGEFFIHDLESRFSRPGSFARKIFQKGRIDRVGRSINFLVGATHPEYASGSRADGRR
jgi:hypothetical protein